VTRNDAEAAMNDPAIHKRRQAWGHYGRLLDEGMRGGYSDRFDVWGEKYTTYAQFGIVLGGFSDPLAAKLRGALAASPLEPYRLDSVMPAFEPTVMPEEFFRNIDKGTQFYRPSAAAMWWLEEITEKIGEQVAAFFGSPWRILCVRAWKMTAESSGEGPNDWHVDGLPSPVVKIMLFPQAIGPDIGTTEIQFPNSQTLAIERGGPTWMLFKSSEVRHRGLRPQDTATARYTVELTVVPSPRFALRPVFGGSNARHPHLPWLRSGSY
jgi:hypothetical protein